LINQYFQPTAYSFIIDFAMYFDIRPDLFNTSSIKWNNIFLLYNIAFDLFLTKDQLAMKQKINMQITFSDGSQAIEIQNVYEQGNFLIAVSRVKPSGMHTEAITKRKDKVTVETSHEQSLPVKYYIINDSASRLRTAILSHSYHVVNSVAQIPELNDAKALPIKRETTPSLVDSSDTFFANRSQITKREWNWGDVLDASEEMVNVIATKSSVPANSLPSIPTDNLDEEPRSYKP
jgi:hypothetical protein